MVMLILQEIAENAGLRKYQIHRLRKNGPNPQERGRRDCSEDREIYN